MIRKRFICIVTGMVILILATVGCTLASAASSVSDKNSDGVSDKFEQCFNFVDANGDGICDNCTASADCPQDGTGRQLKGASQGKGYTDANGDGICHNGKIQSNRIRS